MTDISSATHLYHRPPLASSGSLVPLYYSSYPSPHLSPPIRKPLGLTVKRHTGWLGWPQTRIFFIDPCKPRWHFCVSKFEMFNMLGWNFGGDFFIKHGFGLICECICVCLRMRGGVWHTKSQYLLKMRESVIFGQLKEKEIDPWLWIEHFY